MRGFGLATKITVPFVALFTALLAVLGVVLAREIFHEVEARVEREQRFVLAVAAYPHFRPSESFLRGLRARSAGEAGAAPVELAVLQKRAPALTTWDPRQPQGAALLEALRAARRERTRFPGLENMDALKEIQSTRCALAGRRYLVLYVSRLPGDRRLDYFLLYPQSNIERTQRRALWFIAALGLVGLLLAAFLGRWMAHVISRPVRRLAASAARLTAGGLNEALEADLESSQDEIGELSRAFQAMVESLRRSQRELLKAERLAATGKLAASVAHEIRNPLTSMRMTVQMLAGKARGGTGPDEGGEGEGASTREAYRVILGEIDRLALAVEELLTFARPRPPQRAPTDLHQLIAEVLELLARQLEHAGVAAVFEPDAALPKRLPLDANKIRQLLVNLILNAMQAIVRNGTVRVRTRWEASARRAVLEVADTGPGIPEAVREKLFDLFVSTKPGGGGMGLAIAKQVVEEHDGAIGVESSERGATFRVELPVPGEQRPLRADGEKKGA